MVEKLLRMDVNPRMAEWIFSFLTNRPQRVRVKNYEADAWSTVTNTNTGAPQGCVMSPALFTIYTSDCQLTGKDVLQIKFSDDTSISGMAIGEDDCSYRRAVDQMVVWCRDNYLLLNIGKTKEIIVDFRRNPAPHAPLLINDEEVEIVQQYKYLGTILDNKLDWTANTKALVKKGNQRLYFLRKLRSFGVRSEILRTFYQATVESVLSYNNLCFNGNLQSMDSGSLTKLTKTACSIVGGAVNDLNTLNERKALKKIRAILGDPSHPLHAELAAHRTTRGTSGRLRSVKARTNRFLKSFLPSAIRLYNQRL